ncbi:putative ADP,ATP carrier protein 1, mitochondrial precursor, putative,ADP/ATP translocase 1 [Trypanosoma theileri]|uniref:Putative ADP,ATP carrier protein 1, mitochondrial, putative,ADP/ATP translocase 1 n=1 Tax=Trypanosoma theileri TaxID=67003 RepID=A0A1X0PA63_9TRYP|nr:putative ADP,ATP carrier protein 1, mitochondrial precursor, putative,ADP/ATP translocase 1 [Trypanosoma theileri]ORC93705.1 putative ADP,ATP carrier protein 1, mitochondrial precursor, putative,ADP/ATP translocase 1 [Trypanosoma theileri]
MQAQKLPANANPNPNVKVESNRTQNESICKDKSHEQHLLFKRDWYTTGATFFAGGFAGACSRTLTAPLDRIKIIVQEGHLVTGSEKRIPTFRSSRLIHVFNLIRADGGWRSFWRGNGINCLKAGPEFAFVFTLRRYFLSLYEDGVEEEQRRMLQREEEDANGTPTNVNRPPISVLPAPLNAYGNLIDVPRIFVNFCIGAWAGFGAQLALYPLEVVKTRIAVSKTTEFRGGIRQVVAETYQQGGIREFYRGLTPNMVGVFLYRGLEVGVYSTAQQQIMMYRMRRYGMSRHDASLSSAETAGVGMVASILAQTVSYPLNVVRTRLQTQGINGRAIKYTGMIDCFVKMVRTKGPASLFSGITANYLKAVPASSCMFVVFEGVQKILVGDD